MLSRGVGGGREWFVSAAWSGGAGGWGGAGAVVGGGSFVSTAGRTWLDLGDGHVGRCDEGEKERGRWDRRPREGLGWGWEGEGTDLARVEAAIEGSEALKAMACPADVGIASGQPVLF